MQISREREEEREKERERERERERRLLYIILESRRSVVN